MKLIREIFLIAFCCEIVLGKIKYSGDINGNLIDYYPFNGELKPIPELTAGQRSVKGNPSGNTHIAISVS